MDTGKRKIWQAIAFVFIIVPIILCFIAPFVFYQWDSSKVFFVVPTGFIIARIIAMTKITDCKSLGISGKQPVIALAFVVVAIALQIILGFDVHEYALMLKVTGVVCMLTAIFLVFIPYKKMRGTKQ